MTAPENESTPSDTGAASGTPGSTPPKMPGWRRDVVLALVAIAVLGVALTFSRLITMLDDQDAAGSVTTTAVAQASAPVIEVTTVPEVTVGPIIDPTTVPTIAATAPLVAEATDSPAAQPPTLTTGSIETATTGGTGTLAWRDQSLFNDQVIVSVSGLPALAAEEVYAAWLSGPDDSLALGTLAPSGDAPAILNFSSPAHENLPARYDRVYITRVPGELASTEVANVVMMGVLPGQALVHIRHVLSRIEITANQVGFAVGLRQEADEMLRHARFLRDAFDAGDFALVKLHAEHLVNIVEGSQGEHFGDQDGDGRIKNPGDGFGILAGGQQLGYNTGMRDHARLAAAAPDATDSIKLHAGHVQIAAENTSTRVTEIRDRALNVLQASGLGDTQPDVTAILSLAQQAIQGVDTNLNEQVEPIPGEGGVLTAYQHAQLMAGIAFVPGTDATAADAPQPAPVATVQPIAIDIGDDTYVPGKISVAVGTTVRWTQAGQLPHTVTADAGSFDSGTLDGQGTFEQTFQEAGVFPYFCLFHGGRGGEGMSGTIIVVAANGG